MFELKNIYKSFNPDRKSVLDILKDVNLKINEGEIFGLIGLSGAGKSTLLRIFNLLEAPNSGEILFKEQNLSIQKNQELRQARQKIGMIFQQFNLLSNKSVKDNIALPLKIAGWKKEDISVRVKECLSLVGLEDKIDSYPNQLSGGQKQRVAIARSIANHPSLLLADEPTSALDPITKRDILNCLQEINKKLGLTIIITTHEMNVIRQICNRVAVLNEGVIQEVITVNEGQILSNTKVGQTLLELT